MKKNYNIALTLVLGLFVNSYTSNAQTLAVHVNHVSDKSSSNLKDFPTKEKLNYNLWEVLLNKNVTSKGIVNYKAFKKDSEKLNDFLRQLSRAKITTAWTKNDKIAYWINVYNAYTVKLIVNNYPVHSIKQIENPWKEKFFAIDGKLMNLHQVEHEILRNFGDPRIHFAINCASASCPRLIQVPYTAANLERLLERQTKEFINDPFYNTITGYAVNVSKIFDWYKKDFKQDAGTVVNFINKYSNTNIKDQEEKGYKQYDWSINSVE